MPHARKCSICTHVCDNSYRVTHNTETILRICRSCFVLIMDQFIDLRDNGKSKTMHITPKEWELEWERGITHAIQR